MTIEVVCQRCGKEYRLKEDYAGRAFRCRQCESKVKVPDSSENLWDDDFESYEEDDYEDFAPPKQSQKKKKRKKKRKSIPIGVMIALVLIGLNSLSNLVALLIVPATYPNESIIRLFVIVAQIGFILGILQRSPSMRLIIIGLNYLSILAMGCSTAFFFSDPRLAAALEAQGKDYHTLLFWFCFAIACQIATVAGLSLESSREWFTKS